MKRATGHLFRRGRRWYLQFLAAGVRKTVALYTEDEASARQKAARITGVAASAGSEVEYLQGLRELGEWAQRRLTGEVVGEDLAPGDLAGRWAASLARQPAVRTMETYRQMLGRFAVWCGVRGIAGARAVTPAAAREYVREIGREKATPGRDAALLRRVWRDLGLGGAWMGISAPKAGGGRYRRISLAEARQVWATACHGGARPWKARDGITRKGFMAHPDLADLVLLGWSTGLRLGDAMRVRGDQVDGGALRLIAGKTRGRGGRPLLIPLTAEALGMIRSRIEARGSGALFDRFGRESLFGLWEAAGVLDNEMGRASFHSLRATFISMMDEAGVPPHVTDAITGHAPQGMHGRYSQPSLEALREAVARAIPALGVG